MFLLKVMPMLDILATISMLFLHFGAFPSRIVFPFSMYLIAKGIAFRDVASIIDLVAGAYILGMIIFGLHTFLVYVFAAYLLQKALFGLF